MSTPANQSAPLSINGTSSSVAESTRAAQRVASQKFPSDQLKPHIAKLLNSRLIGQAYKARPSGLTKELADSVKAKMLGFKYIVQIQLLENLGQGGRADMACHWEEGDTVTQEMFTNETMICSVTCLAIRAS
ncbi:hypothetical protein K437DRAFT_266412 [Tilletiaria anomala UBC 951]|uniref:Uncharacterized protein n=1 Tax=Tilletiaria anomala (strain ATCC 24038 / CBS 436.72 / UBC 951) TaxID=1037660 RepID=A0A066WG38_TILAU|nr:uncharacterized protein K437DRAFT_266412 [Tilletiaria anomala UBC 951]KDN52751.1 hypothetical protein K437DRAFT_266412 [Tilletiaria anomala UBC 951]